jgi:hypothetical protein
MEGFLFPPWPWLFLLFKGSCIDNSLIIVQDRDANGSTKQGERGGGFEKSVFYLATILLVPTELWR